MGLSRVQRGYTAPTSALPLRAMSSLPPRGDDTRAEIAAVAARLIAEEGADWAGARTKAAHIVLGAGTDRRGLIPDAAELDSALREHLRTFAADTHPPLLAALRRTALQLMERFATYDPHLVGGVLTGTATEHSDIRLQLFAESAKEVEIALLNADIDFEALPPSPDEDPAPEETLIFVQPLRPQAGVPRSLRAVGVRLAIHDPRARRVAPRWRPSEPGLHPVEASGRANRNQLEQLLQETAA